MITIKNDATSWGPEADKLNSNFTLIQKLLPKVLDFDTDVQTTRLNLPENERFQGKIISYKNGAKFVIEQYISINLTDSDFINDANWQNVNIVDLSTSVKEIINLDRFEQQFNNTNNIVVNHNLNRYPSILALDSAGNSFIAQVNYPNKNTVIVSWNNTTTGKIVCN